MTYSVSIYNSSAKVIDTIQLDPSVFDDNKINLNLIHEYILMQNANARKSNAHTKGRSDVKTSTRKLYRQKSTGRARVGEASSPTRRGGGVAWGPTNAINWNKRINKKQRKLAILGSILLSIKNDKVLGLQSFDLDNIKTKDAVKVLDKLSLSEKKTLFVFDSLDDNYITIKSIRNIADNKIIKVDYTNPKDLLSFKKIVFVGNSLNNLINRFASRS